MKMINKTKQKYFHSQVELLLKILPYVAKESCFALKGGTAINFFIRDMPRLSVDIDLTYLPIEPRDNTLLQIEKSLTRIKQVITHQQQDIIVREKRTVKDSRLSKLFVSLNDVLIKIEPNEILRGSVYPTEYRDLAPKAEQIFQLSVSEMPVLSLADLYGGKICAALDRQHPRDLFDIKLLMENEGITNEVRQAFVIYLASHSRPLHELLNPNPNLQDMRKVYEEEFVGMTDHATSYEELVEIRLDLIKQILKSLTINERNFLVSIKTGTPNWALIPINGIDKLPGLQWKIMNVIKMNPTKHSHSLGNLKKVLEL